MKFTTISHDPQQMPNKSTSRDQQQPQNQQITNPNSPIMNHNQNSIPKPSSIQIQTQSPIPNTTNNNHPNTIKGTVPYDNKIKDNLQTTTSSHAAHITTDISLVDDSGIWTDRIDESNEEEYVHETKEDNNILSNMEICKVMDQDLNDIVNALSLEKEFSDLIMTPITPNPTSNNNNNIIKTKKKKRKKLRKGDKNNGISYNPNALYRAQGNIQISKQFTGNIIPMTVRENICNIYSYIDKCTAICLNMNENVLPITIDNKQNKIRILNYNFHDKENNNELYCVVQIQDVNSNASRGYKWKMINKLYYIKELEFEYDIKNAPKSFHDSQMFKSYKNDQKLIKNVLMNNKSIQQLIDNTPWHKTDIFNKVNNKRRMHLFLTKPEFMKQFRDFLNSSQTISENEINLIPILMFNDNDFNEFWIEHIWIITIDENINIGISLKYNNKIGVKVSGIHLDRHYLIGQHELVLPYHQCNCFNNFNSNINYLSIGNPDDSLNKIKYYKQQIDELTKYKLELQTLQKQNKQITHINPHPPITRSKSDNCNMNTKINTQINKPNKTFNPNANIFVSQQQQQLQQRSQTAINIATTNMHQTQINTQPQIQRYSYTLPPYNLNVDPSLQRMASANTITNTPHSQIYGLNTLNSPSNISYNSSYGGNMTNNNNANVITPNYNRNMNINNNTYNK